MKPIRVRAVADADLDRALDYYAEAAPQQLRRLLAEIRRTFSRIATAPGAGSQRFGVELGIEGLRHRPTMRFPYFVFYVETAAEVVIVRILHQRSDIATDLVEPH